MPPSPDRPAELGVQRLYSIGRVDDFPDPLGKGVERDDLRPGAPPALADRGVSAAPFAGFEGGKGFLGRRGVGGAVDVLQRRGNRLAILVGGEIKAVTQQMDDAGLDRRLGKDREDGLGEVLQPVDDGQELSVLVKGRFRSISGHPGSGHWRGAAACA